MGEGYAVEIEDLYFKYEGSEEPALSEVNLKIRSGEYVLITGPSGSGKSTLCRALNGLIPHFYKGEMRGEVRVFGMSVKESPTYELAKYVGMVFQEPENQLFLSNVERELAFGLENLGLPKDVIKRKVKWALKAFRLEDLRDKAPYELSGGQQQKVAIASVLVMEPKILVLDEPTSNLDPLSASEIISLVHKVNKDLGLTVILVEHRLELALRYADRLILMKDGKIVSSGDPRMLMISGEPKKLGVGVPKVVEAYIKLRRRGMELPRVPLSSEELAEGVKEAIYSPCNRL